LNHVIKTFPATEPVTLAEMRKHLGINQAAETLHDDIITGRIISARQWSERYTRQAFITQTLVAYGADFPNNLIKGFKPVKASGLTNNYVIALTSPLVSVTSVKYLDNNGTIQTLDPTSYIVDTIGACIMPAYNQNWPTTRAQLNGLQIEYISGYGAAANVPESIKDAIRFIVGQWQVFQNSIEGVMRPFTIPNAAKQLLDNYIDMREWF
jgi:uncharacterized phiE125 gp8 family phage protein